MSSGEMDSEPDEPVMRFAGLRIVAALVVCVAALAVLPWVGPAFPDGDPIWQGWWTNDDDDLVIWDVEGAARVIYDYYVEELVPCLAANGYQVGEVPTWEEFWDDAAGLELWDPYSELRPEASWQRQQELFKECPPNPPAEDLSGSRT